MSSVIGFLKFISKRGFWLPVFSRIDHLHADCKLANICKKVHIHVPKYLCDVAYMVKKEKWEKWHFRTNSFVNDQLTCCPSLYFVSKFKSRKYVFTGKKHVIYHDIVQEIKFKRMVKSYRHKETFLSRKSLLVAWLALSSLFWAKISCALFV